MQEATRAIVTTLFCTADWRLLTSPQNDAGFGNDVAGYANVISRARFFHTLQTDILFVVAINADYERMLHCGNHGFDICERIWTLS